ncbi:Insertion element protein [Natronorubrum tibetense GA33]|uniref:Insertion element protein n=1 Tax=Natronorubrum tibetense GA33 TaxID=1114856 RepID=L9W8V3_9EURY|nr:Insertion element protein [Natronorubrum tibetense GA33]
MPLENRGETSVISIVNNSHLESSLSQLKYAVNWSPHSSQSSVAVSAKISVWGRESYDRDKPTVFTLVDRGTGDRYVIPAKSADESTVRLLLANRKKGPLIVYIDRFRAYDQLNEDDAFDREYVVHGNGEYADKTFTSTPARAMGRFCNRGSRLIEASQKISSHSISEPSCFDGNYCGDRKRSAQTRYQSHAVRSTKCYTRVFVLFVSRLVELLSP